MWQEVRSELHPKGLEVVTVALDVDPEEARPSIEAVRPDHPTLIDSAHVLDARFGVVNVPNGVWIDEDGMIVRPAEPAHPGRNPVTESFRTMDLSSVPADVLAASLFVRFRSRQQHTFAEKILSAMRKKFGGHVEKPAGG